MPNCLEIGQSNLIAVVALCSERYDRHQPKLLPRAALNKQVKALFTVFTDLFLPNQLRRYRWLIERYVDDLSHANS